MIDFVISRVFPKGTKNDHISIFNKEWTMKILFFCLCIFFFLLLPITQANGQNADPKCGFKVSPSTILSTNSASAAFSFLSNDINKKLETYLTGGDLYWRFPDNPFAWKITIPTGCKEQFLTTYTTRNSVKNDPSITYTKGFTGICAASLLSTGNHRVQLIYYHDSIGEAPICEGSFEVQDVPVSCKIGTPAPITGIGDLDSDWAVDITNIHIPIEYGDVMSIKIDGSLLTSFPVVGNSKNVPLGKIPQGNHTIEAFVFSHENKEIFCDQSTFYVSELGKIPPTPTSTPRPPDICFEDPGPCANSKCGPGCNLCPGCTNVKQQISFPEITDLCKNLPQSKYINLCFDCVTGQNTSGTNPNHSKGVWTAIGCIPTDFTSFINDYVLKYGIGIAGGIAFLRFLYGCFLILTSSGNPETIEEAKAIITSSLMGLLFVIFSVFLLRTIGVDILQIPEFGPPSASSSVTTPCPGVPSGCTPPQTCQPIGTGQYTCK